MADEKRPAKKVVKRVVKKTVVRPSTSEPSGKPFRHGRPVSTQIAKAKPSASPKAANSARIGAAGKAISSGGSRAASGVGGAARSASRTTGALVAGRFRALRDWRIPHLHPRLAAGITGLIVGLVAVVLGLAALTVFSEVRGVASGGGRWGSLTFVVVTFVAFVLGELLLSAFGSTQARLTSFLGVVLTIIAILGLFLDLADSIWALALVPALGAVAYVLANWLLDLAEGSPTIPE